MLSISPPNKNNEPLLVKPKIITKIELNHSKADCINGTFNIATAKTICINRPLKTNAQSMPFLFHRKLDKIRL